MKYRIGGKDGRPSLGKISKVSLADAQAAARDYFAMVARKINPSVERAKAVVKVNDTVEGYIDDFIKYLRDDKKRSAAHVDGVTRTLRKYAAALHAFNPADVDRAMVAKQLKRIKNESGASTADHCRSHLSGFFRWLMVEEGLPLPFNPVKDTATNSPASRDKVSDIASELRPIWTALPPPGDDYGDMVRLLFLCGSRRMEIAALDRAEVNFEARQIELQGMRTKSRRPHFVPLSEPALAILKARASRTGFMFGCNGNVFSAWSFYKKELDARSGVANWVLHDARRLLASSLVEKESLIRRSSRTLSRRF